MSDDSRPDNLLDELAIDAPMRRMRARLDDLVSQPPDARRVRPPWLALAAAVVIAAIAVTLLVRWSAPRALDAPTRSVLELLEAQSTFERLRGVNAAATRTGKEPDLRAALLQCLETDPSLNVRLAALQVLLSQPADSRQTKRLLRSFAGQETAIIQAHIGHQLRHRGLLTEAELRRLIRQPGVHEKAREALIGAENL